MDPNDSIDQSILIRRRVKEFFRLSLYTYKGFSKSRARASPKEVVGVAKVTLFHTFW